MGEEMNGNEKRVKKLVHQGQIVSQIRQLAQAVKRPPRDFVHRFFEKFESDAGRAAFQEGVDHFHAQIRNRAVQKKKEEEETKAEQSKAQLMSAESEAAQNSKPLVDIMYDISPEMRKSLAPKGVDPVVVYEALPDKLKLAFKESSVELLQKADAEMDPKEFALHFQR